MPRLQDEALLLRRTPYGESSLVVHALTRRHGRVHLMAKGAYRPTSRLYCVLDFFDTLELEWNTGKRRDLAIAARGDRLRRRRSIPESPRRYRAALAMVELAELAAQPEHADRRLFEVLEEGLAGLESEEPELQLVRFLARYLDVLGLAPALESCAACGREAPPVGGGAKVLFSADMGGRLCASCAAEARASGQRVGTLSLRVVELAAMLARGEEVQGLDPTWLERARDLFERFLAHHLERSPRLLRESLTHRSPERTAAGLRTPSP